MKYAKDQNDKSLDFDGAGGTGYSRTTGTKTCANPYSIGDGALSQNAGRGPTRGNASSSSIMGGKNPNMTIATASQGKNIGSGYHCPPVGNPDKINKGLGPRKGNE